MDRTRWMLLVGLLAAPALSVTGGCGGRLISTEQEIAMGQDAAPQFAEEFGGRVDDAALQQYVTDVGMSVARKCDRELPYEFILVRSEQPNAFALPGGKIFLTAGLMDRMTNERQMAAVLRAGYNPWGMVELLTVLKNLSEREPGSLEEMFSTHPLTDNRIDEARETIEDDHDEADPEARDPDREQFLAMRNRLRRAVPGLPAPD